MIYDLPTLINTQNNYKSRIDWIFQTYFIDQLNFDERQKLEDINLTYPLFSQGQASHPCLIRSFPGERRIVLPILTIKFLDDLSVASSWLQYNGYCQETIKDYLAFIKYNSSFTTKAPLEALRIPEKAWHLDLRIDQHAQKIFKSAILWLIGHEVCHLIENHSTNHEGITCYSESQELVADQYALDVFKRSGTFPIGLKLILSIISRSGKNKNDFYNHKQWQAYLQDTSFHPVSAARLSKIRNELKNNAQSFIKSEIDLQHAKHHLSQLHKDLGQLEDFLTNDAMLLNEKIKALTSSKESLYPSYQNQTIPNKLAKAFYNPGAESIEGLYLGRIYQEKAESIPSNNLLVYIYKYDDGFGGKFIFNSLIGEICGKPPGVDKTEVEWILQDSAGEAIISIPKNGCFSGTGIQRKPVVRNWMFEIDKIYDLNQLMADLSPQNTINFNN